MTDNINIGGIQAGAVVVSSTDVTVQSATINIHHSDAAKQVAQLRALLDDLVRVTGQHGVPPQVQASATAAVAEAANATPDTGRLRALMNAVQAGAGKLSPVAKAALNVINVINGIENMIH
jgi:hypothetical protein